MGIELDTDIDLAGSLSISLGNLSATVDRLDKTAKRMADTQRRLAQFPRQLPLFATFAAAGFYDAGGPQMGRFWEVRLFGVTGLATPALNTWVVGGTPPVVTLYEGQLVQSTEEAAGILVPTQVRWQLNAMPAWENFSGDQVRINQNQHLIIGASNLPVTTQLYVVVVINDIPVDPGDVVTIGA